MALTTATFVESTDRDQPGTVGRLKARRIVVTFTAGYDSTTGVTLAHGKATGINEIVSVIPEGTASTGATVQAVVAAGDATLTLWNGTTKVATSDQSATTVTLLVLGH
jgi:hypothetical protein